MCAFVFVCVPYRNVSGFTYDLLLLLGIRFRQLLRFSNTHYYCSIMVQIIMSDDCVRCVCVCLARVVVDCVLLCVCLSLTHLLLLLLAGHCCYHSRF